MKKIILFILITVPVFCFAQSDSLSIKTGSTSIGFLFSPERTFRTVKSESIAGDVQKELSKSEKAKFGFTTGLSINHDFNKYLAFETGLLFSNKGYKDAILLRNNANEVGEQSDINFNLYYLDVPLKAKFYFWELPQFRCFVSGGLSINFFLLKKLTVAGEDMTNTYYPDGSVKFNKVNLSGMVNLGLSYNIIQNIMLEASAGYKHAILPLNDLALKRHLYSLGLDMCVYYRF
ncbi:PorT family protein [Paludibacter sp. 221]|uniref:porin family protein n=1 Tax=Paludibacter sp. 221 TaxID=2302939 RepID=UPI0013D0AF55|nr:porin family protein [Paludibacter sp. 221]NDV45951.1 PorT family protein [Paludibacter sp. 221]